MSAAIVIAGREIRDSLRNRRVLAATGLMAALALTLTLLGSAPTGTVGVSKLSVTIVSLASLTIFLVPLIALLIAHDAISGEMERGTMALLLAHPVRRIDVIGGKFAGHALVLAIAAIVGYGTAALALAVLGDEVEIGAWAAFATMVGTSILLGLVFIALGYLVSASVRDSRTAAAAAIGLWLFFVLIYDMALLGVLVADQGRTLTPAALNALLLANPSDVFRLINLTSGPDVSLYAGMAGVAHRSGASASILISVLVGWIAIPLLLASLVFMRREL
ncbi:Cu-processing system permease protein [Enhydrobacter aerosaccus]|uniref:Cu-processing system permease protein n=1 Tax=Enhydrobacter aerosaccus TaxID=225324 RepID=A0A1T4SV44_9HYPH|nr:ABC transporter permease subunit [Enhydrobacter aerosaccus]SKA32016.1 Cu-processing system permease protein [Enhydrobacter aerosaccus]